MFDQWWEWATKPTESLLMIPAEIHNAVTTLTEEERQDRALVNEAVRTGGSPWRPPAAPTATACRWRKNKNASQATQQKGSPDC